jgi:hypothetical protein
MFWYILSINFSKILDKHYNIQKLYYEKQNRLSDILRN